VAEGRFSVESHGALSRVVVRLSGRDERERWDRTMRDFHYLGTVGLVGKSLRYVAELDGEWAALIGWCGAAFKCGPRERWIGWPEMVQWRRLRFVVNNSRFLILPGIRLPNLASRILGLNSRRLSADWKTIHGHEVLVVETFVDPRRFLGTCYRAAGWEELGLTRGFARSAGKYVEHGEPKRVFVRALSKDAAARLRDPTTKIEKESAMTKLKLDGRRTDKLLKVLVRIPDHRYRRGRLHSSLCIWSIVVCATLAGAKGFTAIGEFASRLTQGQRKRLDCRKNPKTGRHEVPTEKGFRDFLNHADVDAVDRALEPWYQSFNRGGRKAVAIDGKTLRASGETGKKVHLLGMLVHGTRIMVAQREVGEKTNEIPEAPRLLQNQNLEGVVVTADAMHTQKELANFLVDEKKADFVFVVKDNQPRLHKDVAEWFEAGSFPPSGENVGPGTRPNRTPSDSDDPGT
jgi:hypothetical protein